MNEKQLFDAFGIDNLLSFDKFMKILYWFVIYG